MTCGPVSPLEVYAKTIIFVSFNNWMQFKPCSYSSVCIRVVHGWQEDGSSMQGCNSHPSKGFYGCQGMHFTTLMVRVTNYHFPTMIVMCACLKLLDLFLILIIHILFQLFLYSWMENANRIYGPEWRHI